QNRRARMRGGAKADDLRPETDWLVVPVTSDVIEGDVNRHGSESCRLATRGRSEFRREERILYSLAGKVHFCLERVEIFMEAGIEDFVDVRERQFRAEFTEHLLARTAEHAGRRAGDGVE